MSPGFIPDHPHVLKEGHAFVEEIRAWLTSESERPLRELDGSRVAGIYGGRGTGKTSVMLTLYERLKCTSGDAFVVPKVEDPRDALFAPADAHPHDDTLFLLLAHLERYDHHGCEQDLRKAREAEARRRDVERFMDYEKDVGASAHHMRESFVEVRAATATTGKVLREAFQKIVERLRGGPERRLVLFVDDLDLQPQRALELLEALHLLLNWPGVIVFFAADKDLLLHSIETALGARGMNQSGLAGALLTKFISHEFRLPALGPAERVATLRHLREELDADATEEPAHWFPEGAWTAALDRQQHEDALPNDESTGSPGHPSATHRKSAAEWAEELLGPALPPSYRGLIATHNRLWTEHSKAGRERPGYRNLRVADELCAPLSAVIIAADVRYPELGLRDLAQGDPQALLDGFDILLREAGLGLGAEPLPVPQEARERLASAAERIAATQERPNAPAEWPLLDRLRAPYLRDRELGQARRVAQHVARVWQLLNRASAPLARRERILAVSLSNDATRMAGSRWRNYPPDKRWHVDLTKHGGSDPAALQAARTEAHELLRAEGVPSYQGSLELHIKIKLALAVWLGWELRYLRRTSAGNLLGAEITLFPAPEEPIRFLDRRRFERLRLDPEWEAGPSDADNDAVVLIDLLSLSQPGQLGAFVGGDGRAVNTPLAYRLVQGAGQRIEPADVVPILTDVLELLGRLQQERGVRRFHLGFIGPDEVAFFLGQQLNAWPVSLYEFYGGRYEYCFDLDDPRPA